LKRSLAMKLATLPPNERQQVLADLSEPEAEALEYDWLFWARPDQIPPAGDWSIWLVLSGRGYGKTRMGAESVRAEAESGNSKRIAIIAPTAADARKVCVEGESGILSISPPWFRPAYQPSQRQLTWPNGVIATLYSAEEPERLRGPQHDFAWGDEVAAWKYLRETWDMLQFGLRLGRRPRQIITTTPKPYSLLKEILARPDTVITRGSTTENAANLAPAFLRTIVDKYKGTRLGRQELDGELIEEVEGALWTRAMLESARLTKPPPPMKRVVIGVDPAVTAKEESNLTGIIGAGLGLDGRGYLLADASGRYSPDGWARKAVALFDSLKADRFVAEGNQGGDMVRHTINSARPNAPVTIVHASRGKQARGEPIAALYEQNKISHCGVFPDLEDQMCVVGDTAIATNRGEIAARDVRLDDLVLTRQGFAPLKWVGQIGIRPTLVVKTLFGSHVRLTHNHPVLVDGKGFVRAADLRIGDGVVEWQRDQRITASSLKARNIIATGGATIVRAAHAAASSFTSRFGKVQTALFQMVMKSITSISTPPAMILQTSSALHEKNTIAGTEYQERLRYLEKREAAQGAKSGKSASRERSSAPSAARSMRRLASVQSSARHPAVRNSTIIAIETAEPVPVWDLTVDGPPEFFAGNILVHNCTWEPLGDMPSPDRIDAMVWAFTALMLQEPATATFSTYQIRR
jgi:phage terminase large subunit-like protein